MARKSLAEELAELANPAPTKGKYSNSIICDATLNKDKSNCILPCLMHLTEYDPDADIFGSGPALEEVDDELLISTKRK